MVHVVKICTLVTISRLLLFDSKLRNILKNLKIEYQL